MLVNAKRRLIYKTPEAKIEAVLDVEYKKTKLTEKASEPESLSDPCLVDWPIKSMEECLSLGVRIKTDAVFRSNLVSVYFDYMSLLLSS